MSVPSAKERALRIHARLASVYPGLRPLLRFENAYQLLIASILSAQTTDRQVNSVTGRLFSRYPDSARLAAADTAELEQILYPVGFYRVKARNIRTAAVRLKDTFNSRVPDTMEDLLTLPGVGRKCANVVLAHAFGRAAVIVDTHFMRVVKRLRLTVEKTAGKIERELRAVLPEEIMTAFSMLINFHGRSRCTARKPDCPHCEILPDCPHGRAAVPALSE